MAENDQSSSRNVSLPEFWTDNPAVWFIQAEAQFQLKGITDRKTKFYHIVSKIPKEIAVSCVDIIGQPNE